MRRRKKTPMQGNLMDTISSTDTVLILGVGNTLLTDEGFGMRAVAWLRDRYDWPANVTLQEGGTQGLMLMTAIQECSVLIVLDVVLGGQEPGTIYLLENEDLRKSLSFRDSMHQTDLVDTLATCELIGCRPRTIAFGLEPYDFRTMHPEISPQAEARLPEFCRKVVAELARRGLHATEKVAH